MIVDAQGVNILLTTLLAIFYWRRKGFCLKEKEKASRDKNQLLEKRDPFFDFIRGIAILAVIGIHVSFFFNFVESLPLLIKGLNEFFNRFLRFAIGFFLVSSGALLRPPSSGSGWGKFYSTKIKRIFPAYLVATLVGLVLYQGIFPTDFSGFKSLIQALILGSGAPPFYFIPLLFQFYLIYPFLLFFSRSPRGKNFLVGGSLVLSLASHFFFKNWGPFLPFFSFTIFFVAGIIGAPFLRQSTVTEKRSCWRKIKNPLLLLIFLYWLLALNNLSGEIFYNDQYFYSLALFLFFFLIYPRLKMRFPRGVKILTQWGRQSLGLFLWHFIFLNLFFQLFGGEQFFLPYWLGAPLLFILTLITNLLFLYFLRLLQRGKDLFISWAFP